MKAIVLMFDSLNRHMLPNYGCDWTHAPNFKRLGQRTVTFDKSYVCSMPCMPARRDLHTARPNFLHRSWGPLEPFDDSIFELLKTAGVQSHLATDHYHYFEDGGATYHNRYNTFEYIRGQEGDAWKGQVADPIRPPCVGRNAADDAWTRQDWVNRGFQQSEEQQSQPQTFAAGIDYIRRNHRQDKWVLQLETFDPHEPFYTQRKYKDLYAEHYDQYRQAGGKHFDWPMYRKPTETPAEMEHLRFEYAALLSMCDAYLGNVLDVMDELDLWKDTMLIVWTDHGFMLGEKDCVAKMWMPMYEEISHTPFFLWDPRSGETNVRRSALVQPSVDVGPTLLNFFGLAPTPDMLGKDLSPVVQRDQPQRDAAMFGIFGGQFNVTDGRYVYLRATQNPDQVIHEYTHMPTRMRSRFKPEAFRDLQLGGPFSFTKGARTMKIPAGPSWGSHPDRLRNLLFDLQTDPQQLKPITDPTIEQRMIAHATTLMQQADAPAEQFLRLGLQP